MTLASIIFFGALLTDPDPEIQNCLTTEHYIYKGRPKKEGSYQNVLTAKVGAHIWFWQVKFFCEPYGLIWIQKSGKTDPKIQISGFLDPDPSAGLQKKFYLPKSYMDYHFCSKNFLIWPFLLGAIVVIFPTFTNFY